MSSTRKHLIAFILCLCMVFGSVCTAQAARAPKTELSKLTFDVDYYYNTYADLQKAIGYDPEALLQHYLDFGLK